MNELAIVSLLVTLIFCEITQLVPGGIVVPFYFALYLEEPVKIVATLISALVAVGVVRLLEKRDHPLRAAQICVVYHRGPFGKGPVYISVLWKHLSVL